MVQRRGNPGLRTADPHPILHGGVGRGGRDTAVVLEVAADLNVSHVAPVSAPEGMAFGGWDFD